MGHFLWNFAVYSERRALFLGHLKNNLGNEFEHLKSCDIAGKSHSILGTELWGSCYEELLVIGERSEPPLSVELSEFSRYLFIYLFICL